jgi:hypothetical protein
VRWWLALVVCCACGRIDFDPTSTFCDTLTPAPLLCSDFDEGLPFDTGWSNTSTTPGIGVLDTANVGFKSSHSLLSGFAGQHSPLSSGALMVYLAPGTYSTASLEWELFLPARPASSGYEIEDLVMIVPGVGKFYNDVQITAGANDYYIEEFAPVAGGLTQNATAFPAISTGTWHHFVISLDLGAKTYNLELDGVVVLSGSSFFSSIGPGMIRIDGGIDYVQGDIADTTIYTDNIVLRGAP